MRFLIRAGTILLHLAVFFVLLTLLSMVMTYFTAERYVPGNIPSRLFPLVAVSPPAAPAGAPQYELLRWPQLVRKDPPPLSWNLRLPAAEGGFAAPVFGGLESHVRFSAVALADGRQRVDIKVTEDDYVIYATYATDGKAAQPEYFRLWGPTSALVALFPAFVLTLVLSRLLGRWRRRAGDVLPK